MKLKLLAVSALLTISAAGAGAHNAKPEISRAPDIFSMIDDMDSMSRRQLANVDKIRAVLPYYRDTVEFKRSAEGREILDMAITKVSQSELPKTITPGADTPSTTCHATPAGGGWDLVAPGSAEDYSGVKNFPGEPDVTAFSDGSIYLPSGLDVGTYRLRMGTSEECSEGYISNVYIFKVTPPCPTSVTLTH